MEWYSFMGIYYLEPVFSPLIEQNLYREQNSHIISHLQETIASGVFIAYSCKVFEPSENLQMRSIADCTDA